jgi:negative regulator of flagellin synthesis FlgM
MVDPVSFGPARPVQSRQDQSVERRTASTAPEKGSPVAMPSLPILINLAAELANEAPPINTAKIAQIKNAIAMGSYRVNPEAIADAMIGYYGGRV